ncbi:hypothetical protein SAY87_018523 [Trapa incisa]|uniref:Uncharacterized protein n=1 Tax=Trapa incisa TaxID=236973 RepID=A0AAN7QVG1_9MYRT|nr:hypothetical protein SAY87_018523 [Trapa incisa]
MGARNSQTGSPETTIARSAAPQSKDFARAPPNTTYNCNWRHQFFLLPSLFTVGNLDLSGVTKIGSNLTEYSVRDQEEKPMELCPQK